ncbi:MAG: undecaprenyl/decaprenyl-phosphate alpha-N-acetylglucosaminyl 1-phosphate transferase [Bdellovibrionaceae bacterium]|nr:undecaprenyl/decaprenyl-phosphate alpha-N-acetylglucosaminyl 1-phosphate transferase [Pseudobdellovibrionaceae bacterium]
MIEILFSIITGLVLIFTLIYLGRNLKVYGQKSFRRIKEESVPQLGGLGILLTCFISAWYFDDKNLLDFLIISLPIVIGGVIDDFLELSARSKLLFQFLSAILFLTLKFDIILWHQWNQHPIVTSILTLFFIVSLCNAINFIDGLDGLVAAYFLAVIPTIYLIPNELSGSVNILLGSVLAFAYFNKKPASIYLGDVGSNFIGLTLAYSFLTHKPISGGWHFSILGYLMIFSLPLIDMTTSTLRRIISGNSPFSADKDHIHHRLLKVGLDDSHVAIVFFLVGALCSNVGWILVNDVSTLLKWSTLFSSVGVLLIILYLVYRTEGQLGKHVSSFGRTLIETYIPLDPMNVNFPDHYINKALIFDLFNYYKELQRKGLPTVVSFVKDVSGFITFRFKGARIMLLSSYSLAIILPEGEKWSQKESNLIINDFLKLTDKHKATRLSKNEPEGIYFYDKDEFKIFFNQIVEKHQAKSAA